MPIEELLDQLEEQPVDGLSITGGEPFDQPAALAPLARAVRAQGKTVWCWTGRTFEELAQGTGDHRALLEAIDVLVDSPRRPELSSAGHGGQRRVLAADSLAAGTVLLLPEA
jgi:anaerobic ribonucleoside-triphosphate reductase activating protein